MEHRKPGYLLLMYNFKQTTALENLGSWLFPTDFSLDVDEVKLQWFKYVTAQQLEDYW